ncbi:uncharacterized protein LOC126824038 [Patella vulgata]|uniref:uncharacterized protein LOC126824038 n=1 Tax=Patella vulgata TaxID=6465 RepID=UPI00217F6CB8|nr:uncharacterized protein LOC126824038 [Patella vulgata]
MANRKYCYSTLIHPSMKDAINLHNYSTLKLAVLVAEFAQQMAAAHEHFSKEIQSVIASFRRRNYELKKERPVDTESTIFTAWESLLHESEMDAQAHLDAASLLIKNVYTPLEEVAEHKRSQAQRLCSFRENFETILQKSENKMNLAQVAYREAYQTYSSDTNPSKEEARSCLFNAHNDYVLQLRSSNRLVQEFQEAVPQVLEELEEIYIDTSNTINVAIESLALLLLTKANEQHRRFEDLLQICRQVNPQLDISFFVKVVSPEAPPYQLSFHNYQPADMTVTSLTNPEEPMQNQIIYDRYTENTLKERRVVLQREGIELASYMKQNQDITNTLINVCQRNLANHQYAKVYETQEDMCRKRNEIRVASMQLAAIRTQLDMLTPKQNGTMEEEVDGDEKKEKPSSATIKGMWKKAVKSMKSEEKKNWLTKKGSLIRRKDSKEEEIETEEVKVVDPVYSLLKCAADLPKSSRVKSNTPGLGHDFKEYYKLTSPGKKTSPSAFDNIF